MLRCIHAFVVIETNNASLCCQKRTTFLELSLKHISILTIQSISVQSKSSQHFQKQERVSQAYEMSVSKKRVHTKRTTLHFCQKRRTLPFVVRNEQRFQNRYSNIFQFRAYDRFLCSQSLHGIVRNQEKVSQAYETSVSKKRLHTKRTTLHFVVGNERFPLLLGTNNALRIFMVLSETKSASVIKISQRYCLFTV